MYFKLRLWLAATLAALFLLAGSSRSKAQIKILNLPKPILPAAFMDFSRGLHYAVAVKVDTKKTSARLEVFVVNKDLTLGKAIFESPENETVLDAIWNGDTLLYPIAGAKSLDAFFDTRQAALANNDLQALASGLSFRHWPIATPKTDLDETRFLPPYGYLFSGSDTVLVFDDLRDTTVQTTANNAFAGAWDKIYSLRIYAAKTGDLQRKLIIKLEDTPFRWFKDQSKWLPLFMAKNGTQLIAIISSSLPWKRSNSYYGAYLVRIDLTSGAIVALNSEDEGQGLTGFSRQLQTSTPALPAQVMGGNIACLLDTSSCSEHVVFRFAQYSPSGKKLRDVFATDTDFVNAGMPPISFVVTWSMAGDKVLLQSEGRLWNYDIKKKRAALISTGFKVVGVSRWLNPTTLLVQVQPYDARRKADISLARWATIHVK